MHSSSWRSPSARWAMPKEGRRQRGRHQIRPLPSAWWGGAALDLAALECQLEWGEEKGWRRIRTLPSVGGKGWRTGRAVPDLAVPLRWWEGAERGRGGLPHAVITPPPPVWTLSGHCPSHHRSGCAPAPLRHRVDTPLLPAGAAASVLVALAMRERKGGAGEEEEEVRQLFGQRGHNGHRVRERDLG